MEQVGLRSPRGADHAESHSRIHVSGAAHACERDRPLLERGVEARPIAALHVESEEARVDATLAQRR